LRSLHLNYLIVLFPLFLFATSEKETNESFLSTLEYGEMLYKDPRGISCTKCHGQEGKGGKKIAKYYDKNKNIKLLKSIDITHYSLEDLTASLKNQYRKDGRRKRHKIMPMYYLTKKEVFAIFTYLKAQNK
jgi:cytochrome c553